MGNGAIKALGSKLTETGRCLIFIQVHVEMFFPQSDHMQKTPEN